MGEKPKSAGCNDPARTFSPQVDEERRKRNGEVFTPMALVSEILDRFPVEAFSNSTKTWCDPCCGDGNFLIAVYDRLFAGIADKIPDPDGRHRHIIENQIYGVELMRDNVEWCIKRLRAEGLNHNIVCADALTYDFEFKRSDHRRIPPELQRPRRGRGGVA